MKYVDHFDGEVRIRKSVIGDVKYLAENLREADREELKLVGVECAEKAILYGFEAPESICYTLEFKDKVVAMFGCVPMLGDANKAATLWMLSTNEVRKFPKRFMRLAKVYVEMFMGEYETLMNVIHPSNTLSMKLVKNLNAQFKNGFHSPVTNEQLIMFLI